MKIIFLIMYYIIQYNDITLTNINKNNYIIKYKDIEYKAIYTYDDWKIIDSYKINNDIDMRIICSKLISIHPIHSIDSNTYRTVDDLVYEWKQHNYAYYVLPDGKYKDMVKDVDLNPQDQNKNYLEILNSRINK